MTGAVHQTGICRDWRALPLRARSLADRLDSQLWLEREQLILWLPVMFGIGIVSWFLLPGDAFRWAAICVALAVALSGWAVAGPQRMTGRSAMLAGLAMAAGCATIWSKSERVSAPVLERPAIVELSGTVVAVEMLAARDQLRWLIEPDRGQMLPKRVRISFDIANPEAKTIQQGDHVQVRARLVPPPRSALPSGYDFARRAWFEQLGAVGSGLGEVRRSAPAHTGQATIRGRLSAHIRSQIAGGPGAIAAAFATGDRGAMSADDDEAMRRAGLAHLLSISGLHVTAAVAGAMWLALRLMAVSPWLALRVPLVTVSAAVGALVGLGYTLLTGSEIPTVRSLLAALLVLLAVALGREAITLRLVAAGAMVVMAFWPESLIGPSFQLSFAAVTAIVAFHGAPAIARLFAPREEGWLQKLMRKALSLLLTGLAVEFALIPIALFHFHKTGLYGAAANIVAIPLTTFVVMPAEAMALSLDTIGWGAPLWWVVEQSLTFLLWLAHRIAAAPGATASLPAMPTGAYALIVLGGLWLLLWLRRWRWWGVAPFLAGAVWALTVTPPDLLITGDGRHVAVRTREGGYSLLRDRAGDFVRDQLAEAAGVDQDLGSLAAQPGVHCSPDFCVWTMDTGERPWTVMASRSGYQTDWRQLVAACSQVDIIIADRWLPRRCAPRWLKADRKLLADTGGLAIHLNPPHIETVAASWRGMPWGNPPTVMPPRAARPQ